MISKKNMNNEIIVKGAREHNLKNITVRIPKNKFVVISGLSGSGKSTLAFDTIYAEGQRRYVESLSSYARQFLGIMAKPDVDSIEGLSPAISIEQKTTSKNPRSTVGTMTEIYDYFRLIFARIGSIYCPKCQTQIKPQTAENIVNLILKDEGKKILILSPIIRGIKGTYEKLFYNLEKKGYSKVRVDGEIYKLQDINETLKLKRYEKHWIEIIIDKVTINETSKIQITESVEQALRDGNETIMILDLKKEEDLKLQKNLKEIEIEKSETIYSTFGACPNHLEITFTELEPRMFSFNSPFGACRSCLGLGQKLEVSKDLIIPDKTKSIMTGAISFYNRMDLKYRIRQIERIGNEYNFDIFTPINKFTQKQLDILFHGTKDELKENSSENKYEGLIKQVERLHRETNSNWKRNEYERLMLFKPCNTCYGKRLREEILSVKINKKNIIELTNLTIEETLTFFKSLNENLNEREKYIIKQVLREIVQRLNFLYHVGLGYLTLSRSSRTLSGGETQRIRLATQIGSNLTGVLYVLDEPSIGLHQKDNSKLIETLKELRDLGNTLIVIEHDEDTMNCADWIIDMGPKAGIEGGYVTAIGTPDQIKKNPLSLSGQYLSHKKKIEVPKKRRPVFMD